MLNRLRTQQSSARYFDNSSYLMSAGTFSVTDEPLTLACWFYPTSVAVSDALFGFGNTSASDYSAWWLEASGATTGDPVRARKMQSGGGNKSATTAAYVANQWQHAAGVFTSNTSRQAFLDGVAGSVNTDTQVDGSASTACVGTIYYNSTAINNLTGAIAHAAAWAATLTQEEITALAVYRWCPLMIRPQSLIAYYPLCQGFDGDLIKGRTLSLTGTSLWTYGPRNIVYPRPMWSLAKAADVVAATSRGVIIGGGMAL